MRSPAGLRRLSAAAQLCLDRELHALRRIEDAAAALRGEAAGLQGGTMTAADRIGMRGEAARVASAWDILRERRLEDIARRLAELAADREDARARIARACGRVSAIRKLGEGKGR